MLDNITKKNIDDCRDVLVGKVPDPKSQIEQITLALIYKFMDDMDKEAVEVFKGKAKFFVGDFAKYGWRKLFDPSLGGKEMLELYSEALDKLQTNGNIPELFRNIFKNAFLPYKDPNTLRLFLKYINEFEYTHSEKLGDAFEYLLSVMSSQGDAGQFRTPRHIIDFIVACLDPKKNETIGDPACGTAGFLLSAYKYIVQQNTQKRLGDQLTPDQRKKMANNIIGYDISPDMVRLSLVNMYLHGFATPQIYEYDTLSSEDRWNETFDVVLANPPFMTPKGGIRPHKKFGVQANKAEVLFTDYIAEHLNKSGRAGIVVPNGIVATTQTAYKQLRKLLVEDSLIAVISLPAGCFNPYSGVKTSILMLDKGLAKKSKEVLFIKVNNDGYDLGAQRREIDKNDLPPALKAFNDFKQHLADDSDFIPENYNDLCLLVDKEKILENKDIAFSGERYLESKINQSTFECVKLSDYADFKRGTSITKKDVTEGPIPVIAGGQQAAYYHNQSNRNSGSITISSSGAYAGYVSFHNYPIFASDCFTVSSKEENILNNKFLFQLLKCKQSEIYEMQEGGGQPHIYPKHFDNWEIPLPPLSIQEEIVKEIEGYQKIIDGAKMVVENYKPTITINPDWEMVEIKQLTNLITKGSSPNWQGINYTDEENGILFITSENVGKGELLLERKKFVEKKFNEIEKRSILKKGDILTNIVGASIGRTTIYELDNIANINQAVCILRVNSELVNNIYLTAFMNTEIFVKMLLNGSENNARANVSMGTIGDLVIHLPTIKEQNEIVEQIEQEQALVNANKELISIFEQKIKDRINAVWGGEKKL
jgi:type I restriction enzyme M protein